MNNDNINVIAKLNIKKGVVEEATKNLKDLQIATRKEPGCIIYQLHQSIDDETVFVIYESWTDKSELDNHFQSPYFKYWGERADQYVDGPPEVTILRKIN
jgi:quinol monooxygenase YgiN